jgi:hypothetical protein
MLIFEFAEIFVIWIIPRQLIRRRMIEIPNFKNYLKFYCQRGVDSVSDDMKTHSALIHLM